MDAQLSTEQMEIIQEFVQECSDLLEHLEPVIVGFGEYTKNGSFNPTEAEMPTLHEVFRLFHSIKGSAGFLNFSHMSATAHAAESLLDRIRKGERAMVAWDVDLFCATCDFFRDALASVANNLSDSALADRAAELTTNLKNVLEETDGASFNEAAPLLAASKVSDISSSEPAKEEDMDMAITPEMVEAFVMEGQEQLLEIEQGLLAWSEGKNDPELIAEMFRKIHSFKGNCGFLGFRDLERLSHRIETVLDVAKAGASKGKPADALLNLYDVLKNALADVAQKGTGVIESIELYLELLDDMIPEGWGKRPPRPPAPKLGEILVAQGVISAESLDEALNTQNKPLGEILVDMGSVTPAQVEQALEAQKKPQVTSSSGKTPAGQIVKRQDLRVDIEKIDTLIDLIGEMVIAENMLVHNPDLDGLELENFAKSSQQMSKIVKELQEVAMAIRMIPVAGLFNRMTRLVHDLSRKSGKKVDFILTGTETEVDKTVIEKISDPLVHLIRNSMDHGLEETSERKAAGKNETGILKLSASHEEGEVLIRIEDDGRGLNREKIIKKALEKCLLQGDGASLTNKEVANLIFLPGFSTADKVTDVSGRGVGMDVVKQNLNQINGKIDIDSKSGQGTLTILRIPLTMAIIDGMLIRVGDVRYIIPILQIRESFRPEIRAITVSPDGQELVKVRDNLYPILRLHRLHQIKPSSDELTQGILILLENQGRNVCLFVDELLGQQQTVIKGLSEYIGKIGVARCVSGCTILGNGDVCLILDVGQLTEPGLTYN